MELMGDLMKLVCSMTAATLGLGLAAGASAASLEAVSLAPGTTTATLTATTLGQVSDTNLFVFSGTAGDTIDIDINRLAAAPDLYAMLRFGELRGRDTGDDLFSELFREVYFGTTLTAAADDTEADAFDGPYGDPRLTLTLTQTGTYSLFVSAWGCCSDDGAIGSPFEIIAAGISPAPDFYPVPLPASGVLLVGGLGMIAGWRRSQPHRRRAHR